jgi:hypothetical protein
MDSQEQPTCGKGLAANSVLPQHLGKVIGAMAEVLEVHMLALDLTDENSKQEHAAYQKLSREMREIAAQLASTAAEMAGYRDLPMGRHDMQAMTHPRVHDTFAEFVQQKQALLALLQKSEEVDQKLLAEMKG